MFYEKLKNLKISGTARLEYICNSCGYMIYKPVMGEDIDLYLNNWELYLLLKCPCCDYKTLELSGVFNEEEWINEHKYSEG